MRDDTRRPHTSRRLATRAGRPDLSGLSADSAARATPSLAAALDTATNFAEAMHVEVWRRPCQDGAGTAVLLRASPTTSSPLLCSGDFTLLQGGLEYNAVLLQDVGGGRLCADLGSAITVILDAAEGPSIAFDREQAFTLSFAGWASGAPSSSRPACPARPRLR